MCSGNMRQLGERAALDRGQRHSEKGERGDRPRPRRWVNSHFTALHRTRIASGRTFLHIGSK